MKWYRKLTKQAAVPQTADYLVDAGAELPHPPGWSALPPPPAHSLLGDKYHLARHNVDVLLQALQRTGVVKKNGDDLYQLRPGKRRIPAADPHYRLREYIRSHLHRDYLYPRSGLREYYYVVNSADLPGAEDLPLAARVAGPFSKALERTLRQVYPGWSPADARATFVPHRYAWSFHPWDNRIYGGGKINWSSELYARPAVFPFLHEVRHTGSPMSRYPHLAAFMIGRGRAPGWMEPLARKMRKHLPRKERRATLLMEEAPARFSELIPLLVYHRNELQQAGVDPYKALRRLPLPPYDSAAHFLADAERFGLVPGTKSYNPQASVADYMVKSPYARKLVETALKQRPFPIERLVAPLKQRGVATGQVPAGQVRYVTDPYQGRRVDLRQWQDRMETPLGLQLNLPAVEPEVLDRLRAGLEPKQ